MYVYRIFVLWVAYNTLVIRNINYSVQKDKLNTKSIYCSPKQIFEGHLCKQTPVTSMEQDFILFVKLYPLIGVLGVIGVRLPTIILRLFWIIHLCLNHAYTSDGTSLET